MTATSALAASIRRRLLTRSREQAEDFNLTLTRYAIERLLYRLAQSPFGDQFVLKGALLFMVWTGQTYRPTRDLDLAGFGDSSAARLQPLFAEVCRLPVEPDGLDFEPDTIRVAEIREAQEYPGQRVRLVAWLGQARIPLQIDIGFGDAITPMPDEVSYPTLLNLPAPRLKVYPKETVIAEKFQAMVSLGLVNSRMKDYYDIWLLTRQFSFEGRVIAAAIGSTFERRVTELPVTLPAALTARFGADQEKEKSWQAFLARSRLGPDQPDLAEIVGHLANFFGPLLAATADQQLFDKGWSPDGGWA